MYILRNALRCISRSRSRSILIGIIILALSVAACIGLSIRQASESAKEDALAALSVEATISFDRQGMMDEMMATGEGGEPGEFDKSQFAERMGETSSLTLEEYQKYAEAKSVNGFYYTASAFLDGGKGLDPVSTSTDTSSGGSVGETPSAETSMAGGMPGGMMAGMASGEFTVIGYGDESAMTSFVDGTASITEGEVFEEGAASYACVIPEELATYNSLSVGDEIELANPNNEDESYKLTVSGIYANTASDEGSFPSMGMTMSDPANQILVSYATLQDIAQASSEVSVTVTNEDTGAEYESALNPNLEATYTFAKAEDYYAFQDEVYDLGLDDSYVVSSNDIAQYENSLTPLTTLSTMAGWFLAVVLIIGAVVLVVLNTLNVRERKYEIGVLTAMGMKKGKVALQFLTETFVIAALAVVLGTGIGAAASVPVTNTLLEAQTTAQESQFMQTEANFGRPGGDMGQPPDGDSAGTEPSGNEAPDAPSGEGDMMNAFARTAPGQYITQVNSAVNLTVVAQMALVAILLVLASGAASVFFVMRYDPLKILANRD